jgi:carbon storage regulator CsrA
MLILSRKTGEKIVIGDSIVVVVKRISGQRVTIGIEAPHDVHIVRSELEPMTQPAPMPPPVAAPTSPPEGGLALHVPIDTPFTPAKPR